MLADHGLVVALQQRAARFPFEVAVDVGPNVAAERLDPSVESTAWFVVSEALTNVAKHAAADRVGVPACAGMPGWPSRSSTTASGSTATVAATV